MSKLPEVTVCFTPAEHAALTEAAQRARCDASALLRAAFLTYITEGNIPPSAAQVRAWLREHGWVTARPGPAGALWRKDATKDPVKDGVGVPHAEGDWRVNWGAVERIARHELRAVVDVAMEMLAISEEEAALDG